MAAVCWTSDGTSLYSGHADGLIAQWDVVSAQRTRSVGIRLSPLNLTLCLYWKSSIRICCIVEFGRLCHNLVPVTNSLICRFYRKWKCIKQGVKSLALCGSSYLLAAGRSISMWNLETLTEEKVWVNILSFYLWEFFFCSFFILSLETKFSNAYFYVCSSFVLTVSIFAFVIR